MSRSVKKGPFIEARLLGRIEEMNKRNEKKVVKSWSRASVIFPTFIGHTIAVYNGSKRGARKHADQLVDDGRATLGAPADYQESGVIDLAVKAIIDKIEAVARIKGH